LVRSVVPVGMIVSMQRFKVRIEGHGWEDFDKIELPRPPSEGDTLETKLGTTIVTSVEPMPESQQFAATIHCRIP
jgi:hypothetical protein